MYTLCIVDDDIPVLEFLTASMPWEQLGFQLIGTYHDPLEALNAGQQNRPDAIISDIGMPGMDGLELIRRLREGHPGLKVVILSCHDEFPYAQAAVKLGVSEYVLKETMNVRIITEVLERLKEQLDAESSQRSKSRMLERELEQNRSASKRSFIRGIVNEPLLDPGEWRRKAEEFGIRLEQQSVLPVFGYVNRMKEAGDRYQSKDLFAYTIENIIQEMLNDRKEIALFTYDTGEVILLFPYYSQLHIQNVQKVEQKLRDIQSSLQHFAKVSFSFLTGSPVKEVRSLKDQLQRMTGTRNARFYLPESSVIQLDHVSDRFGQGDLLLTQYMTALEELRRTVFEQQTDRIAAFVAKWIDFVQYHRFHPMELKEWLLKMILDVRMRLKSLQHYQSSFSSELLHHDMLEFTSLREVEAWLRTYLQQAVEWAGRVYEESHNREIAECQRYVYNHLDRKISLEEAAAHLHLHPSYLSRLFKRETGENFVEYVTRMRMEKAKELLVMTDKTIEEIAELLGYDNKNYFGKLFKAQTGVVPNAYRSSRKG
ncbi:helix-turn-helix domain-containing protein [Paenibacillus sp. 32352]|uniref:helix-turn-helix domain-containing protein n=1 Tax=Paenibacillus sp. 32352 TaxID=1969111 RepID=UPI0009AE3F06|nr:helix-turn-helix domain-containing protein [Paenibacillus sp. 32352]